MFIGVFFTNPNWELLMAVAHITPFVLRSRRCSATGSCSWVKFTDHPLWCFTRFIEGFCYLYSHTTVYRRPIYNWWHLAVDFSTTVHHFCSDFYEILRKVPGLHWHNVRLWKPMFFECCLSSYRVTYIITFLGNFVWGKCWLKFDALVRGETLWFEYGEPSWATKHFMLLSCIELL